MALKLFQAPRILQIPSRCLQSSSRNMLEFASISKRRREFVQKKLVGYSMGQMFNVVSDVGNYNKFVPFCKKSLVYDERPDHLTADLVIGFPPLNESYTSHVTLKRPTLVKSECVDGKMFHLLITYWRFSPGLKDIPQSCVIDFSLAFEFKSALHSQLANFFFDQLVKQMESAFISEARHRYGLPTIKSHVLGSSSQIS